MRELRDDVTCADLVGVDGMGVLYAARLFGIPVPVRVAGIDLMQEVIGLCAREGFRPCFLGATEQVLARAMDNLRAAHPSLQIAGSQHGYFDPAQEDDVVAAVRACKPDCLFVAMPTPRKERFLAANREYLDVPFVMGVGGSLEVIAGQVKRAPAWAQAVGLEWFFRFLQNPGGLWKRYLTTNTAFLIMIGSELLRSRTKGMRRQRPSNSLCASERDLKRSSCSRSSTL